MVNWNNWQNYYNHQGPSHRVCSLLGNFRQDLRNEWAQNHYQAWGNAGAYAMTGILQYAIANIAQFNVKEFESF